MRFFKHRRTCIALMVIPLFLCAGFLVYSWLPDADQIYSVATPEHPTTLAFSPDGKMLAVGFLSGGLALWDAETGTLLQTLSGHGKEIVDIAFSADSKQVVSVAADPTIGVWDVTNGKSVKVLGQHFIDTYALKNSEWFQQVVLSKDGSLVIVASNYGRIFILDQFTDSVITMIQAYDFDARSWTIFADLKLNQTNDLLLSADSGLYGGSDMTAKLWHIPDGKLLAAIPYHSDRAKLTFNSDGTQVMLMSERLDAYQTYATDGKLLGETSSQIDMNYKMIKTSEWTRRLEGRYYFAPSSEITSYDFGHDSEIIAVGGGMSETAKQVMVFTQPDARIFVWRIGQPDPVAVLVGHSDNVQALAFSPDGQRLASISLDNTLRLWDLGQK